MPMRHGVTATIRNERMSLLVTFAQFNQATGATAQ
jgi:hypothetical protein